MNPQPSILFALILFTFGCGTQSSAPSKQDSDPTARSSTKERNLEGRVLATGQPVSGATVRVKATSISTLTGQDGRFQLVVPRDRIDDATTITASKPGYIIAGIAAAKLPATIELRPVGDDSSNYAWVDPHPDDLETHNCGNCHGTIFDQWAGGAHSQSAKGRQFIEMYAGNLAVDSEHRDGAVPGLGHNLHNWSLLDDYPEGAGICMSCHAPSAPLDDLGIGDIREASGVVRDGVHCDFCHKISEVDLRSPGLTHGRFAYTLNRPQSGQLFFGPLDDVDRDEDSFLPTLSDSRFCAPCHEGTVFGTPVYTTYSEWLASPAASAGKHCQSCHMKPNGRMTNIAPGNGGLERDPKTLASHELLPGGRLAMLERAVDLKISKADENDGDRSGEHSITVRIVANNVGHRVPTGFIDRHLLLVVFGVDSNGQEVNPTSGPTLPSSAADQAGMGGAVFAKQLRVPGRDHPVPFWVPGAEVVDTRLVPEQTQSIRFTFERTVTKVRAKVLYRKFWRRVELAKNWPDSTLVVAERELTLP